MKKVLFSVFAIFIAFSYSANAQCDPDFTIEEPGLSPADSLLPCIVRTEAYTQVIQFKNFETFEFGGQNVTIQSLKIDSIGNVPEGLTWVTNKADDTFAGGENGCILMTGTTEASAGVYPLDIFVIADIGIGQNIPVNASDEGLGYALRVKEPGGECPEIGAVGLREISNVSLFSVYPNPVNDRAYVQVNVLNNDTYTYSVYDVTGKELKRNTIDVVNGINIFELNVENFATGIYFISVSNGNEVVTERLIVQ